MVYTENFTYSNGALAGNGGWAAGPSGYTGALVSSNQVKSQAVPPGQGSSNANALGSLDVRKPFTLQLTLQYNPGNDTGSNTQVTIGNPNGKNISFNLDFNTGDGAANQASWIQFIDANGTVSESDAISFPANTNNRITLAYDGKTVYMTVAGVGVIATAFPNMNVDNNTLGISQNVNDVSDAMILDSIAIATPITIGTGGTYTTIAAAITGETGTTGPLLFSLLHGNILDGTTIDTSLMACSTLHFVAESGYEENGLLVPDAQRAVITGNMIAADSSAGTAKPVFVTFCGLRIGSATTLGTIAVTSSNISGRFVTMTVNGCIAWDRAAQSSGTVTLISASAQNARLVTVQNCGVISTGSFTGGVKRGIHILGGGGNTASTGRSWNNTVYSDNNMTSGIVHSYSTGTLTLDRRYNISVGPITAYGVITTGGVLTLGGSEQANVSGDGTASGTAAVTGATTAITFANILAGLNLLSSGVAIGLGSNIPVAKDIAGNTRVTLIDAGAIVKGAANSTFGNSYSGRGSANSVGVYGPAFNG